MDSSKKGALTLPAAVIIAGAIMAIAIIWVSRPGDGANDKNTAKTAGVPNVASAAMAAVSAGDHILGNPNAPIKLIEYSDPSCPFCKVFHPTMERIMTVYGPSGNVAWVYRQFPIAYPDSEGNILHPNSENQAEALECAASLGGNTVFFAFLKEWFDAFPEEAATRPAEDDQKEIDRVAKKVGLEPIAFDECLSSHKYRSKVRDGYDEALNAGITGTPHTVLLTPSGKQIPLPGLQSYATIKNMIDTLILTLENAAETASTSTTFE